MAENKKEDDVKGKNKNVFYLLLPDIKNELQHYSSHFKGKTVLSFCHGPIESYFTKYFLMNFNKLGLKKLISLRFSDSPMAQKEWREKTDVHFDPEILSYGMELTAGYAERGITAFEDFARVMIDDMGDSVRRYLKAMYKGGHSLLEPIAPEIAASMTPDADVDRFDIENFANEFVHQYVDPFTHKAWEIGDKVVVYKLKIEEVNGLTNGYDASYDDVDNFLKENPPTLYKGNESLCSPGCVKLLKEADIVVASPPFSEFSEYVTQLNKLDKKFLVVGSLNNITYKGVFPLIKNNKLWLGYGFERGNAFFLTPSASKYGEGVFVNKGIVKFRNCCWFTNLEHNKRHTPIELFKSYTPEEYPKYDNYDAINVNWTHLIPGDYDGVMGVPVSFLNKYCPEQFELIGATESEGQGLSCGLWDFRSGVAQPLVNRKRIYKRIFIRKLNGTY